MAYLQSRAGVSYAGVTYCGWTPPNVQLKIAGTNRISNVLIEGFSLTHSIGQPSTLQFTVKGITPSLGSDVKFLYATPNDYWFGGRLVQRQIQVLRTSTVVWHCTAIGYEWELDLWSPVLSRGGHGGGGNQLLGVNTIASTIISGYTDSLSGFRLGYCASSIGTTTLETDGYEPISTVLKRLASAPNDTAPVYIEITPERVVNIFTTPAEASPATITESQVLMDGFTYGDDVTQIRTRMYARGFGTTTTAAVRAGDTVIPVADVGPFKTAVSAQAMNRSQTFSYTGTTETVDADGNVDGSGTLTGVSNLNYDIPINDPISLFDTENNLTGQADLATMLGWFSGYATEFLDDSSMTRTESDARCNQALATYAEPLKEMRFTFKTHRRHFLPGRNVTVTMTNPVSINDSFVVQSVTITARGKTIGSTSANFHQTVHLSPSRTGTLPRLLAQGPQAIGF